MSYARFLSVCFNSFNILVIHRRQYFKIGARRKFGFFFGSSDTQRAFFADKENTYAVLKVSNFEDIHKVHPTGHCMRTSGRNVVADRQILTVMGDADMQFNEVVVDNGKGSRMLILTWYGNKSGSTGNFIAFRKNYSPHEQWIMWQVAINYRNIGYEEAIERLKRFLITFKDEGAVAK